MAEQFELKVPSVGESITEVQIGKWHKKVGEAVEKDENVVELESDKATVDLPAPATGTIAKMLKQTGETAAVGEVIGYVSSGAAVGAKPAAPSAQAAAPPAATGRAASRSSAGRPQRTMPMAVGGAPPTAPAAQASGSRAFVMPAAERALAQHNLPAESVRPSGPGGRLSEGRCFAACRTACSRRSSRR